MCFKSKRIELEHLHLEVPSKGGCTTIELKEDADMRRFLYWRDMITVQDICDSLKDAKLERFLI